MTSARKLEVPLERGAPLSDSTPPAVEAKSGLNTEGGSTGSNGLFFRHEHPRRALEVNSVIAIVLAALVVAYLLVTCMRHLSKNLRVSSHQVRLLASNFPDESEDQDKCPAPSGDDGEEATTSNMEGDTGLAEAAGGAAAPQPEELGAAAPPIPQVQSRRRLPPATQIIVEKTLRLLQQPAAVVTPTLPLMSPDQRLPLVKTLCKIVAAELSAFCTVPPALQPLRQEVAAAYIALIDEVLAIESTARGARQMELRGELRTMQLLLQRLAEPPPETEKLPTHFYATIMDCQQRVCHWVASQVLHVLHNLAGVLTPGHPPDSTRTTAHHVHILNAICRARVYQVINSPTTRYWVQKQQRLLKTTVGFSPRDITKAISLNPGSTQDRVDAVTNAVVAARGNPTTVWAPLPLTSEEQQQQLQGQQTLQQQLHQQQLPQQHQGIAHSHTAGAYGLLPTPSMPPLAEQPPVVPQTPYAMPHHHQPPVAEHQPVLPFDPVEQDAGFPAVHPNPQLSGHDGVLEEAPAPQVLIQLPSSYYISYFPVPSPLEPSTSSSATTMPGGPSGDFSAQGHHSGSTGQPHATEPTPQQMPTSSPEISSSEDEDAR